MKKYLFALVAIMVSAFAAFAQEKPQMTASTDIKGLVVKAKSCRADAKDNVELVYTLENTNDSDIHFMLGPNSIVFDDEGNKYELDRLEFALYNENYDLGMFVNLTPGIPMKLKMKIKKVDPLASMFKKVMICEYSDKIAVFTNIPIKREGD